MWPLFWLLFFGPDLFLLNNPLAFYGFVEQPKERPLFTSPPSPPLSPSYSLLLELTNLTDSLGGDLHEHPGPSALDPDATHATARLTRASDTPTATPRPGVWHARADVARLTPRLVPYEGVLGLAEATATSALSPISPPLTQ